MKRGNVNGQLRREEVEALDDEETVAAGTYRRASEEELAKRKIYKVSRPGLSSVSATTSQSSSSLNPFQTNSTRSSSAFDILEPLAPSQTPLLGASFAPSNSEAVNYSTSATVENISNSHNGGNGKNTGISKSSDNVRLEKMTKLNTALLAWMEQQYRDSPASLWTEGLQDYIEYAEQLSKSYPDPVKGETIATTGLDVPSSASLSATTTATVTAAQPTSNPFAAVKLTAPSPSTTASLNPFASVKLTVPAYEAPSSLSSNSTPAASAYLTTATIPASTTRTDSSSTADQAPTPTPLFAALNPPNASATFSAQPGTHFAGFGAIDGTSTALAFSGFKGFGEIKSSSSNFLDSSATEPKAAKFGSTTSSNASLTSVVAPTTTTPFSFTASSNVTPTSAVAPTTTAPSSVAALLNATPTFAAATVPAVPFASFTGFGLNKPLQAPVSSDSNNISAPATAQPPQLFAFGPTGANTATTNSIGSGILSYSGPTAPFGGGFNFLSTKPELSMAPKASAVDGDDEDGEGDEGIPILPPEKVLRNESDTDEHLLDTPCKLYRFNAEAKEWADLGKGTLQIVKGTVGTAADGRQRILIRNLVGKLLVNAYLFKDMHVEIVNGGKGGIKFSAVVTDDNGTSALRSFNVRVGSSDIDRTMQLLQAGIASSAK